MRKMLACLSACAIFLNITGCSLIQNQFARGTEAASRELVYDHALDYTYLIAIDTITELSDWELYWTDKTTGKISAYDTRFMEVTNPDDRVVTVWVKPITRRQTSVSLDKASVGKLRANEIIDAIDMRMTRVDAAIPPPATT